MSERAYWFWVSPEPPPSMRDISKAVAERHGLTLDDLRSPRRYRRIAHPRQEAMALIYATGRFSMPQVARFFRKIDHTTVLHAVRAHKARSEARP